MPTALNRQISNIPCGNDKQLSICDRDAPLLKISAADSDHDLTERVLHTLLQDWIFAYGTQYCIDDYDVLRKKIYSLVSESKVLTFLVPGFPAKCPNTDRKVMGKCPDFAEFIAIRTLQKTLRKLESFYKPGVDFIIMSDYHTFDQYIGVSEADYFKYHELLKEIIEEAGCSDIIRVISLSDFPEFKGVCSSKISKKLHDDYGGLEASKTLDEQLKASTKVLEQYTQMKKFMTFEQSKSPVASPNPSPPRSPQLSRKRPTDASDAGESQLPIYANLLTPPSCPSSVNGSPLPSPPASPGSSGVKAQRRHMKNVTRGMMVQGKALDTFMKIQSLVNDYIRLSIHAHPPSSGKFSIDLFKGKNKHQDVLRTAWHHAVVFDTRSASFTVSHRELIESEEIENSCLIAVTYKGENWFYLRVYLADGFTCCNDVQACIQASMIRGSCGIMLEILQDGGIPRLPANSISHESLTSLIKEFGVLVLRGFQKFDSEASMIDFYSKRATHGFVEWNFGPLKKVNPSPDVPGFVNSNHSLPLHFDLSIPPAYFGCDQDKHSYDDFIPREFVLYCHTSPDLGHQGANGATTFVDAKGAILNLHGATCEEWKSITLEYETELTKAEGKAVYFGGKGNVYRYPLIMKCPWTGEQVLRYGERLLAKDYPQAQQQLWFNITASSAKQTMTPAELEEDVRKTTQKSGVYFEHSYVEGDQVYVNNYTMLHGRNGFGSRRELWRVQALPPSDNIPSELSRKKL